MFLHLSVSHSVHRGGVHGRGVCVAKRGTHMVKGGVRGKGGRSWQRGHAWQGACMAREMATLQWSVCILLECILVLFIFLDWKNGLSEKYLPNLV